MRYLLIILGLVNFLFCDLNGLWELKISEEKYAYIEFNGTQNNRGTYTKYRYYKSKKKLIVNGTGNWVIINGELCMLRSMELHAETFCDEIVFDRKKDILITEDHSGTYIFNRVIENNNAQESQWGK